MRKIRPRSRAVKKSEESQRVLDALDVYLEGNVDEPVRWLVRFWQDQAAVMLYRELREIVIGETDPESLFDIWFQDYSKMLSEKMTPVWEQAFLEGWKNNSLFCGAEDVISSESWVRSWIVDHTGDLITNCCNEQVGAIRYRFFCSSGMLSAFFCSDVQEYRTRTILSVTSSEMPVLWRYIAPSRI